ncbi:nickel superoxide dismutase [Desulfacinum infernum DSM 9756]|uniref:Nickel superoxide dismutase n=1 Tax=Desulfacinum infernum DSM 9756 TaxID=1121391 RepID=A0A1M4TII4_9BACT|nr:superoxide dismutase [Ni] [Desulfacinum infernum]SHE44280.1 nickel superoxide dismutase [Desulfacinum infernum DSM 9756]
MRRSIAFMALVVFSAAFHCSVAFAHCEVPCGIYDDVLRVKLIAEHADTIEKSMKQIETLRKESPVNFNQLVRWISNKEEHASQLQHIVSQYFMTQRIKPDQEKYLEKLAVLHKILLAAMKCKQTTELSHVNALRALLKEFEVLYFGHSVQ